MQLIQLFLPLYDPEGKPVPKHRFLDIKDKLTERFGGLTIYQRAPAIGLWKQDTGHTSTDDIVVYEVMANVIDLNFWKSFKSDLETRFQQQNLLIRYSEINLIP